MTERKPLNVRVVFVYTYYRLKFAGKCCNLTIDNLKSLTAVAGRCQLVLLNPVKHSIQVYQLYIDGRINFYAPANYTARSDISRYMKQIIDEISAREHMKTEQKLLQIDADTFKMHSAMNSLIDAAGASVPAKERKKLLAGLDEIRSHIAGNID